ncbi:hypothetical protein TNCV_1938521 [Trichonephila clavipes]|nr:hypothetical protein TNCV_1938521 [Trichonephila clavipes]
MIVGSVGTTNHHTTWGRKSHSGQVIRKKIMRSVRWSGTKRGDKSCGPIVHGTTETNGRMIVGRVQTNPECWRFQLKRRRSMTCGPPLQPPSSQTQAISGCSRRRNPSN